MWKNRRRKGKGGKRHLLWCAQPWEAAQRAWVGRSGQTCQDSIQSSPLLSSSGERGSSMGDGGVFWVAYVVSQEKQQAPCSGVRFFFVVLSSMLRCSHCMSLLRVTTDLQVTPALVSLLRSVSCRNGTQPCPLWERQDGPCACDSLGEGFQDRELWGHGGPSMGLHSCSNKNPAAHHSW